MMLQTSWGQELYPLQLLVTWYMIAEWSSKQILFFISIYILQKSRSSVYLSSTEKASHKITDFII